MSITRPLIPSKSSRHCLSPPWRSSSCASFDSKRANSGWSTADAIAARTLTGEYDRSKGEVGSMWVERLQPLDAEFLAYERLTSTRCAWLWVFDGEPPSLEELRHLVAARVPALPRLAERPVSP